MGSIPGDPRERGSHAEWARQLERFGLYVDCLPPTAEDLSGEWTAVVKPVTGGDSIYRGTGPSCEDAVRALRSGFPFGAWLDDTLQAGQTVVAADDGTEVVCEDRDAVLNEVARLAVRGMNYWVRVRRPDGSMDYTRGPLRPGWH